VDSFAYRKEKKIIVVSIMFWCFSIFRFERTNNIKYFFFVKGYSFEVELIGVQFCFNERFGLIFGVF